MKRMVLIPAVASVAAAVITALVTRGIYRIKCKRIEEQYDGLLDEYTNIADEYADLVHEYSEAVMGEDFDTEDFIFEEDNEDE